jgi:hypothetical protein
LSRFEGPLSDRYWAAVALVLRAGLEMVAGMANAAYCFGTVVAVGIFS